MRECHGVRDAPQRRRHGRGRGEPAAFDARRRARSRARRQVRALRLLPAVVSDLRVVGRGDGLAARTHLSDGGRSRRARGRCRDGFVRHFDACLGCMACVTACPSGVQYAPLIEATRGQIERRYPRPLGDRLFRSAIFALFPYPHRLRVALAPLVVVGWVASAARAIRLRRAPADRRDRAGSGRAGGNRAPGVRDPTEKPDVRTEAPREHTETPAAPAGRWDVRAASRDARARAGHDAGGRSSPAFPRGRPPPAPGA